MRALHASDWRLGQSFCNKSCAAEHQAFLDWLLETTQSQQVGAIIVAGGIFDTGSPPGYARELHNRFVVDLQQAGCLLVVLTDDHDSAATLNRSRGILAFLNTTVVASTGHAPQVLPQRNDTPGAILCPVPFLRPRDIITSQTGLAGQGKQQHLPGAITGYYQQQYQNACMLHSNRNLPIIVTGRLITIDASKSDAVHDIYIGTLDAFPAQNFPPTDYITLGHIHRTQVTGGTSHTHYCGSPIILGFDECGKDKYVYLVSFEAGRLSAVENLTVPVTQPLAVLEGNLTAVTTQLEQWHNMSQEPLIWLDTGVTTDDYLHDIQRKIQALTEDLPVEVLLVRRNREQREHIMANKRRRTLNELSVTEVFDRRLTLGELEEPQRERLSQLFSTALHTLAGESET